MSKNFPMILQTRYDEVEDRVTGQHLIWDYDNLQGDFYTYDLNDRPEDCILTRDLFTAEDYIWAVKFGIELGRNGYEDIEIIEKPFEEVK